jgi:hypothetical protein
MILICRPSGLWLLGQVATGCSGLAVVWWYAACQMSDER